ncbi:MAG TPA: hypothetical protein VLL72_08725 [Kiloniellales bacterium]|nr:hypothetical protein [Kiloniellales bacterium]
MPITYTSKFHSREDPGGIIREILEMDAEFEGPARDALLSWVIRLEPGLSPATAARRLLARYELEERTPAGACGELVKLLRETAAEAAPRPVARPSRRRGRRRN